MFSLLRQLALGLVSLYFGPASVALVQAADPRSEVAAALRDLAANVPRARWATTRYLSQYNAVPSDYRRNAVVASFVLNSVSRSAVLVRPTTVAGAGGRLLRFDLTDYRLPGEVWEALASDREPYWHLTTTVLDPATGKRRTVVTDGGWLDLARAAELRTATHSVGAIVRLDWFVAVATTPPHYYQLAGVPDTRDQWYKDLGVDREQIVALRANHGANLFRSGVTQKPRRLSRYQGPLGGVWQTYDSFGDDPAKDPIRNPTYNVGFDASEDIAAKANGLHLFALFNGEGKRQDVVPDRIAKDDSDPHGDGRLQPMISCVRCHVEDGLRPFANDQQRLLARQVQLFADKPETVEQLAAFYASPKLARDLVRDREDYAAAVARATANHTTPQLAAALANVYREYVNELVSPAAARRELGLESLAPLTASHDPIVLALVEDIAVQRRQFEASFPEAALLARTKSPPPLAKPR